MACGSQHRLLPGAAIPRPSHVPLPGRLVVGAAGQQGGDRALCPPGPGPRVHCQSPCGIRYRDWRAGRNSLRRGAAADCHRPRLPVRPAHPDPRRARLTAPPKTSSSGRCAPCSRAVCSLIASPVQAPNLVSRPAWAIASGSRSTWWMCPRPPAIQGRSPNRITPSGRT